MLLSLSVKNYAIIDKISIDFDKGLNIITGETGAGKSIIIGALSLALGYRANLENIRDGESKMSVQALFSLPENKEVLEYMNEAGIDTDEEELLLTREVQASGRNICRINDTIVNVKTLNNISKNLIDLHGQHEHQKLLSRDTHLSFLDAYGKDKLGDIKEKVSESYKVYRQAFKKYNEAVNKGEEEKAKKEQYETELSEINEVELESEIDIRLEKREKLLMNAQNVFEYINNSYEILYSSENNAATFIDESIMNLEKISEFDDEIEKNLKLLEESKANIEEVNFFLRDYKETLEFDPDELDKIESSLNSIENLKRKYGATIEEILEYKEEIESKLNLVSNYDEEVLKLEQDMQAKRLEYLNFAHNLRDKRKEVAADFSRQITENLVTLAMKDSIFDVYFIDLLESQNMTKDGIDDVTFMISTNKGISLKPLDKVASGGELSRIMLSFKSIVAGSDQVDALIFDEIDTGISGRTAQIVAGQMYKLSRSHQIIAITHLPQIAALADENYLIEKRTEDNNTVTDFRILDSDEKVTELARMLGGEKITENTIAHSREMLKMAKEVKENI